jgi:hypothetical protein
MARIDDRLADRILDFYDNLDIGSEPPPGVIVMNPFAIPDAREVTKRFYEKYYSDGSPRMMIFGINPGRFGGGVTGIPFTDPIRLRTECNIEHPFRELPELSSVFIYQMIAAMGGPDKFYSKFFITALSPLGYTKDNRNLNYYDEKDLLEKVEPFIVKSIRRQMELVNGFDICFCLGEGTNYKYFVKLNAIHQFFKEIVPLPHPRWIMQYRRKTVNDFVELYHNKLTMAINSHSKTGITSQG